MASSSKVIARSAWREDYQELFWLLPVAMAVLSLFIAGQVRGAEAGITSAAMLADSSRILLRGIPLLASVTLAAMLVRALLARADSPLRYVVDRLRRPFSSPILALASLSPLLLVPMMLSGYGVLKMLMPTSAPFLWDDTFAAWDRFLFFGRQPWTITHAIFGGLPATLVIDRLYTMWVPLLSFAVIGFAWFAPRRLRAQFFLTFTAAWIVLGVGLAYLFSSAGPCYAAQVGASSAAEFSGLMSRLHAHSGQQLLGAVQWQQVLWNAHEARDHGFGMGISAMPSLHNSVAIIYALALSQLGRRAAIAGWAFAAVMLIGSVHLGWHYAVDGLLAAPLTFAIWVGAGRYLDLCGYQPLGRQA